MLKRIEVRSCIPTFTYRFLTASQETISAKSLKLWLQGNLVVLSLLTFYCITHSLLFEPVVTNITLSLNWALQVMMFWSVALPFLYWGCTHLRQRCESTLLYLMLAGASCAISISGLLFQAFIWQLTVFDTLTLSFQFLPAAWALCGITILLAMRSDTRTFIATKEKQTEREPLSEKLLVLKGASEVWLEINQVDFVASAGNYIELNAGGEVFLQRQTLTVFLNRVARYGFIRIHRGYVINIDAIMGVKGLRSQTPAVLMQGQKLLPVGRTYRRELQHLIDSCSLNCSENN